MVWYLTLLPNHNVIAVIISQYFVILVEEAENHFIWLKLSIKKVKHHFTLIPKVKRKNTSPFSVFI